MATGFPGDLVLGPSMQRQVGFSDASLQQHNLGDDFQAVVTPEVRDPSRAGPESLGARGENKSSAP